MPDPVGKRACCDGLLWHGYRMISERRTYEFGAESSSIGSSGNRSKKGVLMEEQEKNEQEQPESEEIKDLEATDEDASNVTGGAKRFHRPDE